MKKHILLALLPLAFVACDDEQEGSNPGSDSEPNVVLYQFTSNDAEAPDAYTRIRLAYNSATEGLYLLSEGEADYKANYNGDDAAYAQHVIAAGTKVDTDASLNYETEIDGRGSRHYITAVAVKGSSVSVSKTVSFLGVNWIQVAGTESYVYTNFGGEVSNAVLEQSDVEPKNYRLRGVSYAGVLGNGGTMDLYFTVLTDKKGNELGGDGYRFVSVKSQATGCEYDDFGGVSIRDIATYTKDDSYATSSYGSIITDDNVVVLVLNVYVDAGNLKSVAEETFAPAE